jgi:glycosyltransferase involved in cell wall biosynthesis
LVLLRAGDVRFQIKTKRFCIFSAQFAPSVGGVERYTLQLGRELVRRGHRVTVVTAAHHGLESQESYEGLALYRLPALWFFDGRLPILKPGAYHNPLLERLREEEIDFVIVQTHLYGLSLLGARFAADAGLPLLVIEHGSGHALFGNRVLDTAARAYEHLMMRRLKRYRPLFFGVSQRVCQWLKHYDVEAEGVLYNAVSAEDAASPEAVGVIGAVGAAGTAEAAEATTPSPSPNLKTTFDLPLNTRILSYVSRLIPEKGVTKLLDAVDGYPSQNAVPLHVFIAGDGPLFATVKHRETSRVTVLGGLDHASVLNLLRQSDLFCLPTDYAEGFPTVVLEAAACGCYCLASDKGGVGELIEDGVSGTILCNNNAQEIREKIIDVLEDDEKRTRGARRARQIVSDRFTWPATTDTLLAACKRIERQRQPGTH